MRTRVGLAIAAAVAVAAMAGCRKKSNVDATAAQLAEDTSDAQQTAMDISEFGQGGAAAFAPGNDFGLSHNPVGTRIDFTTAPGETDAAATCTATVAVLSTAHACAIAYNSSVHAAWNCTGAGGGAVVGSADIATLVTPNTCPATQVTVAQTVGFDRTRSFGSLSANLDGTVDVTWSASAGVPTISKTVVYGVARQVHNGANLIRNQTFDGSRDVQLQFNGAGPADDARVVNGTGHDAFLLAGFTADVTETDLTFHRDCCYPVSGTFAFTLSGSRTGDGSLTFGPSCGDATSGDGGSVALPLCVQ